jgi:hypothetical protein
MNDIQEVRFGLDYGRDAFVTAVTSKISSASADTVEHAKYLWLMNRFAGQFNAYGDEHFSHTYVACFCRHTKGDRDGILSMWRGYGVNGTGAAIVINPESIARVQNSPLIVAPVHYVSDDDRRKWIDDLLLRFLKLVEHPQIFAIHMLIAAEILLDRILIASIFSKHPGFSEEKEWRIAYVRTRDYAKTFDKYLSYNITERSIEPKLKLDFLDFGINLDEKFSEVIEKIILGPAVGERLHWVATKRLLQELGLQSPAEKVWVSTIPYRPRT